MRNAVTSNYSEGVVVEGMAIIPDQWNNTDKDYPLNNCLHHFIEAQVEKTPLAPALTYEGKSLSYEALNKRANQLAHVLQSKGVGPETLVGICAYRSFEMVIGLLAILKAGGAYVPFDPTYPPKRLAFMIDDSQVPFMLAQKACGKLLPRTATEAIYCEEIKAGLKLYFLSFCLVKNT